MRSLYTHKECVLLLSPGLKFGENFYTDLDLQRLDVTPLKRVVEYGTRFGI